MAQNKGGNNKGGNKKNKRKAGPLQKRARRDVMFSIDPILDNIRREQERSEREYEQNASRVENIYSDLGRELQRAGAGYDPRAQQIATDLNTSLAGLTGMLAPNAESATTLNPSGQAAEAAAATGMFGAIGGGGQTMLASDRSRQNAWDTSLQREVPLQSADYERRFLQDFRDTIEDLKQQRFDTMQDVPTAVLQRLDQLRDARKQNRLAQSELELRQQIANREHKSAKKANEAGMDILEGEANRRNLGARLRNVRGDIGDLTQQIRETRQGYPESYGDITRQGRTRGYTNFQTGEFVPLPELTQLYQQRHRKRKRAQTLQKRKRQA